MFHPLKLDLSVGCRHHPDLASLFRSARSGCELCTFFLKCAEDWPSLPVGVTQGGQVYIRGRDHGTINIMFDIKCSPEIDGNEDLDLGVIILCQPHCFAPHSSKSLFFLD